MVKYERYDEYKDSGVDRLGEVPSHWNVSTLGKTTKLNNKTVDTSNLDLSFRYVDIGSVSSDNGIDKNKIETVTLLEAPSRARRLISKGDVITSMVRPSLRITSYIDEEFDGEVASTGFSVLKAGERILPKYLMFLLKSDLYVDAMNLCCTGMSYPAINESNIKSFNFPLPPLSEQERIVSFLDAECARIDGTVGELESLVKLLEEKRVALVSEVVSRGIPGSHENFVDSGVEWLGEIPLGWEMNKLGKLFSVVKREALSEDENVTAFRNGTVTLRSNVRVGGYTEADKEHGYQRIHKGDLVINGMDAFAGAIGVSDSDGKSSPVYSACIPRNNYSNSFYYAHLLRVMAKEHWLLAISRGIRERSTDFRWATASAQLVCSPPIKEQQDICLFIERYSMKNNIEQRGIKVIIELLKLKRQTIIQKVITGNIKI